jgi:hypothetical protein
MKTNINFVKKTLAHLLLAVFLLLPVYTSAAPKDTATAEKQKITNLQERANREIDRRVSSLGKLNSKINNITKISDEQKKSLTDEILKNQRDLMMLKNRIAKDAELATLKNDVKSIVDSYKIYGVLIPKINLMASINRTDTARMKLSQLVIKLENQIKALKDNGKDVSTMESSLAEMKTSLGDAETKISGLQEKIMAVTPADYPGNKGVLTEGKNNLALAKKDIADARSDAGKIIEAMKAAIK